ncbi:NitT/TauT family transport system ATP-binding protein [Aliiruegeria haliotis]|uniref:NitT/TauT family transport system ATP-binding protein n=1 Tax=Aliiruegeria haliotis TaxID=1280846 RepID=A0A2T0RIJ7_9RHOB|nr:ABC transporter ATP-binding protein [Aliiruegeria haliotis]PRY20978.1 NitT/TauT family transport system ATP-binding protein [Aliiruegeria haliotis]
MTKSISIRNVAHGFGPTKSEVPVLEPTSLEIDAGEFVCVLGPSGCGKTTLMNMVAGLVLPREGEIDVGGEIVKGPSPARGVIFQEFALMPWKTVLGNIDFGLRMKGVPRAERRRIAQHHIDLVGLSGSEDLYPRQLSGGMKQRTAIARAYAVEPEVLLMDEPFGALDAQTRAVLQDDLLKSWQQLGQTVMFITHDLDEAFYLASRVLVMSKRPGTIVADIKVDIPYPRTPEIRFTEQFTEMKAQAWQLIEAQHNAAA